MWPNVIPFRVIIERRMLVALLLVTQQRPAFLPPILVFAEGNEIAMPGGHAAPAVFDFDEDGKQDLLIGQFENGLLQVLRNTGKNTAPRLKKGVVASTMSVEASCCIGFTPTVTDLDQDGMQDIVSGSYSKGVVFFRGKGKGQFEPSTTLIQQSVLPNALALATCVADFDGDGDQDLIMGSLPGMVYLSRNLGGLLFGSPEQLTCDSMPIIVQRGSPLVTDLDGDQVLDILMGGDNGIEYYRGKEKGALDFAPPVPILQTIPGIPSPAKNLKLCEADWNGDGRNDLLIGDFREDGAPVTRPTKQAEQKAINLRVKAASISMAILELADKYTDQALKAIGVASLADATPKQRADFNAELLRLLAKDVEYARLEKRKNSVDAEIAALPGRQLNFGTVWVAFRI